MTYHQIKISPCTQCNKNSRIVLREHNSTYNLLNPLKKEVCRTHVDGCYVCNKTCCDYLLVDCPDKKVYFIELKGSDVLHAMDQIQDTYTLFKANLSGYCCFARIIPTKVNTPDILNIPKTIKLRKMFHKQGGNVLIKSIVMTETI
jgi:hypothetical protein